MPPSVPPKFVDVRSARSGQGFVNVIGVVADVLPKALSSGSSFMVTFTIKDSDFEGESWDGLKIKYFNNKEDRVPDVQQYDVILLRNLRVSMYELAMKFRSMLISNKG
jgi:protection-of-telomeres protein 1